MYDFYSYHCQGVMFASVTHTQYRDVLITDSSLKILKSVTHWHQYSFCLYLCAMATAGMEMQQQFLKHILPIGRDESGPQRPVSTPSLLT